MLCQHYSACGTCLRACANQLCIILMILTRGYTARLHKNAGSKEAHSKTSQECWLKGSRLQRCTSTKTRGCKQAKRENVMQDDKVKMTQQFEFFATSLQSKLCKVGRPTKSCRFLFLFSFFDSTLFCSCIDIQLKNTVLTVIFFSPYVQML